MRLTVDLGPTAQKFLLDRSFLRVLRGPRGEGKCVRLDQLLPTPTGYRKAADIHAGAMVLAGDGTPTRVLGVYPQPVQPLWRLLFSDGTSLVTSDDHLWAVETGWDRAGRKKSRPSRARRSAALRGFALHPSQSRTQYKVVTTQTIRARLTKGAWRLGGRWAIPLLSGPAEFAGQTVPIDPYVLGVLLGDGGLGTHSVRFTTADPEILTAVTAGLPDGTRVRHLSRYDYAIVGAGGRRPGNPLLTALRGLELSGHGASTKFIPDRYRWNTATVRLAVLQGLLDTDGTASRHSNSVSFSSVSVALVEGVEFLVRSLGGLTHRRERQTWYIYRGERRQGRPSYHVSIRLPNGVPPFRLSRKSRHVHSKGTRNAARRYIVGMEPAGLGEGVCFQVEHPSRLYVVDEAFIVTHNTHAAYFDLLHEASTLPRAARPLRCIVVRGTWTDLSRTTCENLRELERKGLPVRWADQGREASVLDWLRLYFIGMDTFQDLSKFQGFGAGRLWIEEPAPVVDASGGAAISSAGLPPEVFGVGATSLRQAGVKPRVVITMNPPDEEHWTLKLGERLRALQRSRPELAGLTMRVFDIQPGENKAVTAEQRAVWEAALVMAGRGDVVARLIHGKVGFVQLGEALTPEYSDALHLAPSPLAADPRLGTLWRSFDFGLNPTCVWAQETPGGRVHILGARVGEHIGMEQFVETHLMPFERRFGDLSEYRLIRSTGDPAGLMAEQSNSEQTAVRVLEQALGPTFSYEPGPVAWDTRVQSLKALLRSTIAGRGRVQLDPEEAGPVRRALRGGAHYPKDANGNPIATAAAMKKASGIHCVDAATELLTDQGWKRHDELKAGESVWGYDLASKKLRLTPLKTVKEFEVPTTVTRFSHQGFDMVVTDEHRCLVRKRHTRFPGTVLGPVSIEAPIEFTEATHIIRSATVDRSRRALSDAFVRLCAWVWTEGCYRPENEGLGVRIVQSLNHNPAYCEEIGGLMAPYGSAVTTHDTQGSGFKNGRCRTWTVKGDLGWALRQAIPDKIHLASAFVNRLSVAQLRLFVYEVIRGDGTWHRAEGPLPPPGDLRSFWVHNGVPRVFQKRKEAIDQLQAVATLAGIVTAIHPKQAGTRGWSISFTRKKPNMCVNGCRRERFVLPFVWCPETGTGTWVARRNGHVFLTGNSHPWDGMGYLAAAIWTPASAYERPKGKPPSPGRRTGGALTWMGT